MTEPKTFQEAAYLAAKETADLVIKKQKDYGPSNIVALGELGIFVRLWDKINRLLTLLWKPALAGQPQEAQNEPADDTWDDIPGYCLCRKMLKRGWFELPMDNNPLCPKCGRGMAKSDTYVGESSNIYPIGQIFNCGFCGESIGITKDGTVTNVRGESWPLDLTASDRRDSLDTRSCSNV